VARIVCCGEGMLELTRANGVWDLGYGGDTLNTAIHLARKGHDVGYLTALGPDPFSARLWEQWAAEGLDLSLVLTHPHRAAGLYAITTDERGERSFTYWRDASAAREMFAVADLDSLAATIGNADVFCFSLITLSILSPEHRPLLLEVAAQVRAKGGRVAYDGNYRERLWAGAAEARAAHEQAIAIADIGLPTLEDEQAIHGQGDATAVAELWSSLGCAEVIVKLGENGCRLPDGAIVPPEQHLAPVDTSGAGDAFDAGYLDARLSGASPREAAAAGHRLAAWTIMRRGAIPPRGS
jgi:2-dehydro-3-deoxygluconokinase